MKIGFIGCGNMATAIINGITNNNVVSEKDINAYDIFDGATKKLKENKDINICENEKDVVKSSDIIFLAVKPNVQASVLKAIDGEIKDKLIISIAAGKTIEFIESNLKCKAKIVRVMPNINAKVGEAISAYCFNDSVTGEDKTNVESLLNGIGQVLCLDESYFPLFGVIGGCGPAFAYMFIDAMARAGVKNGMKKSDALKISAQTVLGSAKMILESDEHPWQLIDNVCSPGGTTIEGVTSLQQTALKRQFIMQLIKRLIRIRNYNNSLRVNTVHPLFLMRKNYVEI